MHAPLSSAQPAGFRGIHICFFCLTVVLNLFTVTALCLLGSTFSCKCSHFINGKVEESGGRNALVGFGLRCRGNGTPSGGGERRKRQVCSGKEGQASPEQCGVRMEGWRMTDWLTGSSMKPKFSTSRGYDL